MSNFWKLRRQFVGDGISPTIVWPADIELIFRLKPRDLFGIRNTVRPHSNMVGKTKFLLDGVAGKYTVIHTGILPPMDFNVSFDDGTLTILGYEAVLKASVANEKKV